jgi:hypothetical protein
LVNGIGEQRSEVARFFCSDAFLQVSHGPNPALEPMFRPAVIALIAGCQFAYSQSLDEINKREQAAGETVARQDNFGKMAMKSRHRNREFMIHLTLHLNDAPLGDYLVDYKLHDLGTDKTTTLELPFTIEQ